MLRKYRKIVILICFSCLPYLFSLNGDFVFDDSEAIVKNKDITSESYLQSFYNDFWGTDIKSNYSHKSYRPLTILTFKLNYNLSGQVLVALHFKITNLICHMICCILVWQTFKILLKTKEDLNIWEDPAYLGALLFSVHPIHVESVAGIVGRADVLAAILFFAAFIVYYKEITGARIYYSNICNVVILAGMSMLCKENGVTVLGFCALYDLIISFNTKKSSKKVESSTQSGFIGRIVFIVISSVLLLYARWNVMGGTKPEFKSIDNPAAFSDSIFTKLATYNYIYFLNILLLVWPHWLCYDWSMGCIELIEKLFDLRIIFILILYLYGALIIRMLYDKSVRRSSKRHVLFSILLGAVPFLPASNIFFPVGFVIAERVLYIPSAGYCLLISLGFHKIIQRRRFKKFGITLFYLLLLVLSIKTWHRSLEWRTEYLLFTKALDVCPNNAKVRYNVAKVADAKQYTTWALLEYKEAIALYPDYYQAMNNLANLLKNDMQYPEAEFFLRKAIYLKNDFPAAWMNLGIVLASTKKYRESMKAYKMALKFRKRYPDCLYNLGNLYLELNQTQKAMNSWVEAINLNPKHNLAWTNALALLDNRREFEIALELIPKALSELPHSPSVHFAVANIYGKLEWYTHAEEHFKVAIELFGCKVQAIHYANLGVLYHRWKKYDLAQELYKSALKVDPKFTSALENLKIVQKHLVK